MAIRKDSKEFATGLPKVAKKYDATSIIVDWLFSPFHGILVSIFSDRDPRMLSCFWKELHSVLGTVINFNTSFQPQTHEQVEPSIKILEEMLQTCILELPQLSLISPIIIAIVFQFRSPRMNLYMLENIDHLLIGTRLAQDMIHAVEKIQTWIDTFRTDNRVMRINGIGR